MDRIDEVIPPLELPKVFKLKLWPQILTIALCFAAVTVSLFLILLNSRFFGRADFVSDWPFYLLGFLSLFFMVVAIRKLISLFVHRNGFIVSAEGIESFTHGATIGLVPWNEIADYEVRHPDYLAKFFRNLITTNFSLGPNSFDSLIIEIPQYESKYLRRISLLGRLSYASQSVTFEKRNLIVVHLRMLKGGIEELPDIFVRAFLKYKNG